MIELRNLSKSFSTADGRVDALKNVNLTINDGDIYGIIGMSGAGKSTLVRCINMLERPTDGTVLLDGRDLGTLDKKEMQSVRREVTMIFQSFNLLMQSTCLQNIMFPLKLAKVPKADAVERAKDLLKIVGLPDKANAYPAQLSGGQQQRIAIARALATKPRVLLCDEATSALDPKTTQSILELIRQINRETGITVVVITHQMSVVQEICNRVAILEHGAVVEEGDVSRVFSHPQAAATRQLVFPETSGSDQMRSTGYGQLVRLIFEGSVTTNKPLITSMAIECGVAANILGASTRTVNGHEFGYILLEIPGGPDNLNKVVKYISKVPNVSVQVEANYDGREAQA